MGGCTQQLLVYQIFRIRSCDSRKGHSTPIPKAKICPLEEVEKGSDRDHHDNSTPKVLSKFISGFLEIGIVQDLTQEVHGLCLVGEVYASGVQSRGRAIARCGHGHRHIHFCEDARSVD